MLRISAWSFTPWAHTENFRHLRGGETFQMVQDKHRAQHEKALSESARMRFRLVGSSLLHLVHHFIKPCPTALE